MTRSRHPNQRSLRNKIDAPLRTRAGRRTRALVRVRTEQRGLAARLRAGVASLVAAARHVVIARPLIAAAVACGVGAAAASSVALARTR